jgi:hypothetical protein
MKDIGKVKLGMNSDMVVVIESDITMIDENDKDDLYFVMFNIMYDPLRLAVVTIGDLLSLSQANTEKSKDELMNLLEKNPEEYVYLALGNSELLMERGVEKIKIPLDSQSNADKARIIIASMIDKGKFIQKSNYKVNGELITKGQDVETENMIPQLKLMLEIIRRWNDLDLDELAKMME